VRGLPPAASSASPSEARDSRRDEEIPGREEESVEDRGECPADEEARDASSRESRVGAAAYEMWAIVTN
jgi:hypothetical protein